MGSLSYPTECVYTIWITKIKNSVYVIHISFLKGHFKIKTNALLLHITWDNIFYNVSDISELVSTLK